MGFVYLLRVGSSRMEGGRGPPGWGFTFTDTFHGLVNLQKLVAPKISGSGTCFPAE